MKIDGWSYYNHAAIPSTAPHEKPNLKPLQDGSIWKMEGYPLFARWTTDWDCEKETNWWYVIKDTPFHMEDVKSKIRTKIRKGLKNYACREINAASFADEIGRVLTVASASYRFSSSGEYHEKDVAGRIKSWAGNVRIWGAFNEENQLCAYTTAEDRGTYYKMIGHKSLPESEKTQVNAAVLYQMLTDLSQDIQSGKYICNGERSINHDTNFNDYLEEYFCYRKCYCQLNISWRKWLGISVKLLCPFRNCLKKYSKYRWIHSLDSLLLMNDILRENNL